MKLWRCVVAISLCAWSTLPAAELTARIVSARGVAVGDAIVTVVPRGIGATPAREPPTTRFIDQKNETFVPYVQMLRPGESVVFRNSDQTRHHVYSFALARQFEFVLAPGESSAPLTLEHAGIIAVGCNIHDHMVTYLYVSDAPWMARSNAEGLATLTVPSGDFDVRVWHPQLRPDQAAPEQSLHLTDVSAKQQLSFTLTLLPDPRGKPDRERADYP